jgi:hypothetical protein
VQTHKLTLTNAGGENLECGRCSRHVSVLVTFRCHISASLLQKCNFLRSFYRRMQVGKFGHVAYSYHRTFKQLQLSVTVHTQRQVLSWCPVSFNMDTTTFTASLRAVCGSSAVVRLPSDPKLIAVSSTGLFARIISVLEPPSFKAALNRSELLNVNTRAV